MPATSPPEPIRGKYYLYAIRLRDDVLSRPKFRAANPLYRAGKPCYYVGSSIYRPKVRFRKHLNGERSSKWVRDFGLHVATRKCKAMFETEPGDRIVAERNYAEELRAQGYGIWQN